MTDPNQTQDHYALLGLRRDANAAQIRKAWHKRTAKAGPGTPEFVRLNEAAETLLDPHRRIAYDAAHPEPEGAAPSSTSATPGAVVASSVDGGAGSARGARWWVSMVALPVLATVAVLVAGYLTLEKRHDDAVDEAGSSAVAAAQRSLPILLSYDYRHLASDRSAATRVLTPSYAKVFGKTFDLLEKGKDGTAGSAVQTKTVVKATVVGSAVMDAEPDRVNVLAFVNQSSTHGSAQPTLFQNRVRVAMVHRDGRWLVDGLEPR